MHSSDVEEVGTQMMVSRSNLVMDSFPKSKITSPNASAAFKVEAEAIALKEDSPGTKGLFEAANKNRRISQ